MNPPAGWYPDPSGLSPWRFWDGQRWTDHVSRFSPPQSAATPPAPSPAGPVLPAGDRLQTMDRTLAAASRGNERRWTWWLAIIPLVVLVATQVLVGVAGAVWEPPAGWLRPAFGLATMTAGELVVLAAAAAAAAPLARDFGGWARVWGIRRPHWNDLTAAAVGIALVFGTRIVVTAFAQALTHGRAAREASNLRLTQISIGAAIGLFVVAAVIAPICEEFVFRAVLLRTLTVRWGFWPAALVSSALFGGLHAWQVSTIAGALLLSVSVALMGLVNCLLVRATDSLLPGILVHAALNGLAVVVAVAQARH